MIPFNPIPDATKRKTPSLTEKLASCLLRMYPGVVPDPETKTAKEIVAYFDTDHEIEVEICGSNHPKNLHMIPRQEHAKKTAKRQAPLKKAKRLRKAEIERRDALTRKTTGDDPPRDVKRKRIASRKNPWPERGTRKLRSRGFQKKV